MQVKVTVLEASEALEESRGIASLAKINGQVQYTFQPEFLKFCEDRFVIVSGSQLPTRHSVETVRRRYSEFLKSAETKVYDRNALAYRHALARAAWLAFREGRLDDCELFYEEAVVADAKNPWLYDRYAYFLRTQERFDEALDKAVIATNLAPDDSETWFTRGTIEARLGRAEEAIKSLSYAKRNGKPEHLCSLQKAYAYSKNNPPEFQLAIRCLEESEQQTPNDAYYSKHMAEILSLRYKIDVGHSYQS
jgi:tetratricopeptide (TPR) repeat protein